LLTIAMAVALLLVAVSHAAILAVVVIGSVNVAVRGPLIAAAEAVAQVRCPGGRALLAPLDDALPRLRRLRFWSAWSGQLASNELVASFREYLNLLFLLDANAPFFGGRELRRSADALLTAIDVVVVVVVDAALAVASFRSTTALWSRPTGCC
jgi:hypothetical protein